MQIQDALDAALSNIAAHGDTDIFPLPFENFIFADEKGRAKRILESIHADMDSWLSSYPPHLVPSLAQVGYTGFRWAAFIEPFWNAYYLALTISLADQIEKQRIEEFHGTVFSYRFSWQPTSAKLFADSTWLTFRACCLKESMSYDVVVQTDISDFYPRIHHRRLEDALRRLPDPGDRPMRIMRLLGSFSSQAAHGLPVGGPASRILAEFALHGVDLLLRRKEIRFCRYADDYVLFCRDRAEAYRNLVFLAEKLANEGLVLQKKKTRIMDSEEFRQTAQLLDPTDPMSTKGQNLMTTEEQKLLKLSLRLDPYTIDMSEYETLRDAVREVDIIAILGAELTKTMIDPRITRQAVQAIRVMEPLQRFVAIKMLLAPGNLLILSPVFVTVMRVIRDLYPEMTEREQAHVDRALCDLHKTGSPLLSVDVNRAYYIRALAGNKDECKEEVLMDLYAGSSNPVIRRLVILSMAKWRCHYWLSDVRNQYGAMTVLEKRAFILASFYLGHEGRQWRDHSKGTWREPERLIRYWYNKRLAGSPKREVPV